METTQSTVNFQNALTSITNPSPAPTPVPSPTQPASSAKVSVEIPANPATFDPFSPNVIKFLEDVGPIAYLALLCMFIWLLTRFVEAVKGK